MDACFHINFRFVGGVYFRLNFGKLVFSNIIINIYTSVFSVQCFFVILTIIGLDLKKCFHESFRQVE